MRVLALVACSALATGVAAWPLPARAQEAEGVTLAIEQSIEVGTGDDRGLRLHVSRAGARLGLSRTLSGQAALVIVAPEGRNALGDGADLGAGGELSLRLTPWPSWRVSPYVMAGLGLVLFPEDFLPGGTRYDGIITFGVGCTARLEGAWSIGARLQLVHLSNGQGLGPHNPAFDGVGAAIELDYELAPPAATGASSSDAPEPHEGREVRTPGMTNDVSIGQTGGGLILGERLRLAQRVLGPVLVIADVEVGSLDSELFSELGVAWVGQVSPITLAVHAARRSFVGLETLVLASQVEWHATGEIGFVTLGQYERNEWGRLWRAALGLRAFPTERLLIDLGLGFDRIGEGRFGDSSDPYLGVEWQLPLEIHDLQLSVFVERQVSTVDLVGMRASWAMGPTLRDLTRRDGWRRLR